MTTQKTLAALLACAWLAGCATNATAPASTPASMPAGEEGSAAAAASPASVLRPMTDADEARAVHGVMPPVATTELHRGQVTATQAPADLWERIRSGFAMADLDTDLVRQKEQWYATRPDYIQRMTERSRMYIFHIVEELELRGMPTELALLPFIESAFNPQAVSSAKAAGMWQFMPATGTAFDLRQNTLRDDRRDVIESTRAALDYLQKLHGMFGDWHLALASYNWGEGNVRRAIERNRAAGLGTAYTDLRMPEETRHYVPKLQAVKNIITHPEAFGAELPLIENHPFFDTVEITRDMDVAVAARLADVRLEDFKALNPSQRKPVIFAAGTPRVLLPWNNAATFKQNLAQAQEGSLTSWTAWKAPSNMPSREVASRFGMAEADFLAINNMPRGMVIKGGSTVLVRRQGDAAPAAASHVVNNATLAYVPEVVLRRTTVRARKGDTLASIAARYDLPAATVAGWNKGASQARLKQGQAVALYLPVRVGGGARGKAHGKAVADRTRASAAAKAAASKPQAQGRMAAVARRATVQKASSKANQKAILKASPKVGRAAPAKARTAPKAAGKKR